MHDGWPGDLLRWRGRRLCNFPAIAILLLGEVRSWPRKRPEKALKGKQTPPAFTD